MSYGAAAVGRLAGVIAPPPKAKARIQIDRGAQEATGEARVNSINKAEFMQELQRAMGLHERDVEFVARLHKWANVPEAPSQEEIEASPDDIYAFLFKAIFKDASNTTTSNLKDQARALLVTHYRGNSNFDPGFLKEHPGYGHNDTERLELVPLIIESLNKCGTPIHGTNLGALLERHFKSLCMLEHHQKDRRFLLIMYILIRTQNEAFVQYTEVISKRTEAHAAVKTATTIEELDRIAGRMEGLRAELAQQTRFVNPLGLELAFEQDRAAILAAAARIQEDTIEAQKAQLAAQEALIAENAAREQELHLQSVAQTAELIALRAQLAARDVELAARDETIATLKAEQGEYKES